MTVPTTFAASDRQYRGRTPGRAQSFSCLSLYCQQQSVGCSRNSGRAQRLPRRVGIFMLLFCGMTAFRLGLLFPDGNRRVGRFDSRMQPWDRFPSSLGRHLCPMDVTCKSRKFTRQPGTQVSQSLPGCSKRQPSLELVAALRQLHHKLAL